MNSLFHKTLLAACFIFVSVISTAQRPVIPRPGGGMPNLPNIGNLPNVGGSSGQSGRDSVRRRDLYDDSISIRHYYLDSTRYFTFDSSIADYTRRFPIPATHIYLSNTGSATRSLLFSPRMKAGWDPGFHAFDVYKWDIGNVRFYNTTKPYTELGYNLGPRAEQIIEVVHTQNIRSNWNASIQYRLINAPGIFRNQKTNHNNYLFSNWYQSKAKRYNNYFVVLYNSIQAGESGGMKDTTFNFLENPDYSRDRFSIPTNIGGQPTFGTDFFTTAMYTGRREKELTMLMRQQYDLGKKDSVVTDSTVVPLFYPRVRFEHTFRYGSNKYQFQDFYVTDNKQVNTPSPTYYKTRYNYDIPPGAASPADTVLLLDEWKEVSNDFSFYQFPDIHNLQQFFKLGGELQYLRGNFTTSSKSYFNLIAHGEYRNRTKNQKWDMFASGRLHLVGHNLGDYHAYVALQRILGSRAGNLQVGFENVNRRAPFIFDGRSSFYLDAPRDFKKENIVHFFASVLEPKYGILLGADYYVVTNYLYLKNYYQLQQEATIFNVLRVNAAKTIKLFGDFNWHAEIYLQQKAGAAELNLPLFYTRNRIALEGLFFRNLNLSTGFEIRYNTPYKADSYSPVHGKFFFQDSITLSNRPDVHFFAHLRIKSFKAYFRAGNLNTISNIGGFGFKQNSLVAPGYATPGLAFRLGIYWTFIN